MKINFSGHPVDGFHQAPWIGVNLPMATAAALVAFVRAALMALPGREALLRGGPAELVLPGMAPAAAVLLAEWHGQFGGFPAIRWASKEAGCSFSKFSWTDDKRLDLDNLREEARTARAS